MSGVTVSASRALAALGLLVVALPVAAATLTIEVVDAAAKPVADAVVYATPVNGRIPAPPATPAIIDQVKRRYVPEINVIQTGTAVAFPNSDDIRHQVYSFSQPKVFELKLYSGRPANPVVFDRPGLVVLGCNIHDSMVAYLQVVDTPWFGKTGADGRVRIDGVPTGDYVVRAWHPASKDAEPVQNARVGGDAALRFRIDLGPRG